MGNNCQSASVPEMATLQHPDGRVEKLNIVMTARDMMLKHPGYYVAMVPPSLTTGDRATLLVPTSKLKVLPPHAMLNPGVQHRLISFEDVLQDFSDKAQFGARSSRLDKRVFSDDSDDDSSLLTDGKQDGSTPRPFKLNTGMSPATLSSLHSFSKPGSWRPALQSIAEMSR